MDGKDEKIEQKEEKEEVLTKTFEFTVLFDFEDRDFFEKFTRADDVLKISRIVREIYEKIEPGYDRDMTVDHINRNFFDNRRSNLRLATMAEQNKNRDGQRFGQSGHYGVSKAKMGKKEYWRVRFQQGDSVTQKHFPFNEEGLILACEYYRSLNTDSKCVTCEGGTEEAKSENIDMLNCLFRTFTYTILFSIDDKDLFDRWIHAKDARTVHITSRRIYKRICAEIPDDLSVDHANMNCFDNRRSNLRLLNWSGQIRNRRKQRNSTSDHIGVCKWTVAGRYEYWRAKIYTSGKEKSKSFPFTPQGEIEACAWYRKQRADGSTCDVCEKMKKEESAEPPSKKQKV